MSIYKEPVNHDENTLRKALQKSLMAYLKMLSLFIFYLQNLDVLLAISSLCVIILIMTILGAIRVAEIQKTLNLENSINPFTQIISKFEKSQMINVRQILSTQTNDSTQKWSEHQEKLSSEVNQEHAIPNSQN